jgi:spore germination protein
MPNMNKIKSEKESSKESISNYQVFALIYSSMFGAGVLSLPREITRITGTDTIWVILVAGVVTWLLIMLLSWLTYRFPRLSIVQFAPEILGFGQKKRAGKWLSVPFWLALASFWVIGIAVITRVFSEAVLTTILPNTPVEAIMLTVLITGAIAAGSDLGTVAKYNELLLPFSFLPFFFMVFALLERGELTNLLPLGQISWWHVGKGILSAAYAYSGYKVILMFSGFYQQPERAWKAHSLAVLGVTFSFWYITVTSLSVFGTEELNRIFLPVLESIKEVQVHVMILDRIEAGILAIWLLVVFTSVANLYAALVEMIMQVFKLKERVRRWVAFAVIPVVYFLSVIPRNVQELSIYMEWTGWAGMSLSFVIPAVLLTIALIRKKRGKRNDEAPAAV